MPEQQTDRPSEQPAASVRCPSCQVSLPAKAVLCVQCGYDFRLGKARSTVMEKEEAPGRVDPFVLRGLTLHGVRILLSLLAIVLIFASTALAATRLRAGASEPPLWLVIALLAGVGLSLTCILLGLVGSVFCLRVPRESGGRLPLALSLAFDVVAVPLGVVAAILGWPPLLSWVVGYCSWMLFLGFLSRLADYLDRPSEAREAKGIVLYALILTIIPAMLIALSFASRDPGSVSLVGGFLLPVFGVWFFRVQIVLYKLLETLKGTIRVQAEEAESQRKRAPEPGA